MVPMATVARALRWPSSAAWPCSSRLRGPTSCATSASRPNARVRPRVVPAPPPRAPALPETAPCPAAPKPVRPRRPRRPIPWAELLQVDRKRRSGVRSATNPPPPRSRSRQYLVEHPPHELGHGDTPRRCRAAQSLRRLGREPEVAEGVADLVARSVWPDRRQLLPVLSLPVVRPAERPVVQRDLHCGSQCPNQARQRSQTRRGRGSTTGRRVFTAE